MKININESKYGKYKNAILDYAEDIKTAIKNLEKIKGYVKITVSKKEFIKAFGMAEIDEELFSAIKFWFYGKGIIVESGKDDTLIFSRCTFSITVIGIIEEIYEQKVAIIKIGDAKLWVEHIPEWDYLPGDWVVMKGVYCGTIILGDEYIQRFICSDIKIVDYLKYKLEGEI